MKVWLIENDRRYFRLLYEYLLLLTESGDPRCTEVTVINEEEAFEDCQSKLMSEPENSVQLVLVVDGEQIEFLSRLSQVSSEASYLSASKFFLKRLSTDLQCNKMS
jgi:hypothetical protein